jgi:hypothetical protein
MSGIPPWSKQPSFALTGKAKGPGRASSSATLAQNQGGTFHNTETFYIQPTL